MTNVAQIADVIERLRDERAKVVVGIFGFAGAGKSVLARELVETVDGAVRLTGDDFLDPGLVHRRSGDWAGVDRHRLRHEAIEPFRAGRSVARRQLDWATGRLGEPTPLPRASVLVVDAIGLPHPDIDGCFDLSVWVDVDLETARRQGMERDRANGLDHDRLWTEIWSPNDREFEQRFDPRGQVDVLYVPI